MNLKTMWKEQDVKKNNIFMEIGQEAENGEQGTEDNGN